MRTECPSCQAEYDVPEARVGQRRTVRCGRCATEWVLEAPEQASPQPEPEAGPAHFEPAGDDAPPLAVPVPPPRQSKTLRAAWVVSVAIVVALAAAIYASHDDIAQMHPSFVKLFSGGAHR